MRILTMGREDMQRVTPDPGTVVISLFHPADRPLPLGGNWALAATIPVEDSDQGFEPHYLQTIYVLAEYAHNFKHTLVVQCDAGLSRSVGVAKAISAFYNSDYRHAMPGNVTLYNQVLHYLLECRQRNES